MRREGRRRLPIGEDRSFRNLITFSIATLIIAIIAFWITFTIYSNKIKDQERVSLLNSEKVAELLPSVSTEEGDIEETSSPMGRPINEMQNEIANMLLNDFENSVTNISSGNNANSTNNTVRSTTLNNVETTTVVEDEIKKELEFVFPVEGEIVRDFAEESLTYSETLKEWVTHFGIDIGAEKTTIVKAAEDGTVKWIKNDPRYGLSIIIEHEDGFKTVYANLLTTEFVSEGEQVSKGQTIGTVGTTAVFEIADEPHLHFEILKDDVYLDPSIYLK